MCIMLAERAADSPSQENIWSKPPWIKPWTPRIPARNDISHFPGDGKEVAMLARPVQEGVRVCMFVCHLIPKAHVCGKQ